MRYLLVLALWLPAAGSFAESAGAPQDAGQAKRLIIGFRRGVDVAKQSDVLKRFGLNAVEGIADLNLTVAEVPAGKFQPTAMRLMSDPDVYYVEEDFYTNWLVGASGASFQAMPMPTLASMMKELPKLPEKVVGNGEQPWGIVRVNAEKAWPRTTGAGVRVAVVDTGIDFQHPDLAPNYKGGYNAIDKKKPPFDDHGHGTHVAGTIAAVKDGRGVVGVAPNASLYAVKVLDKNGGGRLTSIIKGIVWTGNNGIQVANMSLGSPVGSLFMRMAVMYAEARGVTIVAAAGNSGGSVGYPAAYGETIAVAASDSGDRIARFSSRGAQVNFIAPGVNIKSTLPGGKYGTFSGTSMASPHVAGLAVLAVAQGHSGKDGVQAALMAAAQPIEGLEAEEQGRGMINAESIRRR